MSRLICKLKFELLLPAPIMLTLSHPDNYAPRIRSMSRDGEIRRRENITGKSSTLFMGSTNVPIARDHHLFLTMNQHVAPTGPTADGRGVVVHAHVSCVPSYS